MLDICRHMAFFSGSMLAVLVILTVVDEDVLTVEHVLALMTILGLVAAVCRVLIPNEVWDSLHVDELKYHNVTAV